MLKGGKRSINYTIIDRDQDYQDDLLLLTPSLRAKIDDLIVQMTDDPFASHLNAKPLEGYPNIYVITFPDDIYTHRLVFDVRINTHRVYMIAAHRRTSATYDKYRKYRYLHKKSR